MKLEIDDIFSKGINAWHSILSENLREALAVCPPDEYHFRLRKLLIFSSECLVFLLSVISRQIFLENSNNKDEKMDKSYKKLIKKEKSLEKDTKKVLSKDAKRDKLVTAGKKAMKGKC